MSFLSRLFGRERRSETAHLSDAHLARFMGQVGGAPAVDPFHFGAMGPGGGAPLLDTRRASGLAVFQACVNVIAQGLASVPLNLHRRAEGGGRERATTVPLYGVLHDAFNDRLTAFEGREMLLTALLTNGNAYARIETNGRGQIIALHPIHPPRMAVERLEGGRLRYIETGERGQRVVHLQEEILHLRYRIGPDGVMGQSPIQLARETFSLAVTQQEQAGKQARRAFRPEGALVFPDSISREQKGVALASMGDRIASDAETGRVLVLDGGAEWRSFSMSARDAEFLDSRKLANMDIARILSVPPTVAGITDNATYSNVDGESRALVIRCLAPMARRVEQAMNAGLLTASGRGQFFVEHDLAGLLRGDQKARYDSYRVGREWGWLSPNEIRRWENLPEIEGGDEYLSPLNMTTADERDRDA